jgi:hypothetical protein
VDHALRRAADAQQGRGRVGQQRHGLHLDRAVQQPHRARPRRPALGHRHHLEGGGDRDLPLRPVGEARREAPHAQPLREPVDQLRQRLLRRAALDRGLHGTKRLRRLRAERHAVEAEARLQPLQPPVQQPPEMRRVARRDARAHHDLLHRAVHAMRAQHQAPHAAPRTRELSAQRRHQPRDGDVDRLPRDQRLKEARRRLQLRRRAHGGDGTHHLARRLVQCEQQPVPEAPRERPARLAPHLPDLPQPEPREARHHPRLHPQHRGRQRVHRRSLPARRHHPAPAGAHQGRGRARRRGQGTLRPQAKPRQRREHRIPQRRLAPVQPGAARHVEQQPLRAVHRDQGREAERPERMRGRDGGEGEVAALRGRCPRPPPGSLRLPGPLHLLV